jgi:hypothetical protein
VRVDKWQLAGDVQQFAVSTTATEEHELVEREAVARLLHRMATTVSKRKGHTVEAVHIYPSFQDVDEKGDRTLWSGSVLFQKDPGSV